MYYIGEIILINRNMSYKCVRPTTNRPGTLLMTGEMKHIKLKAPFVS